MLRKRISSRFIKAVLISLALLFLVGAVVLAREGSGCGQSLNCDFSFDCPCPIECPCPGCPPFCPSPTPTPTPTIEATPTPTPTLVEPTPTPTLPPSKDGGDGGPGEPWVCGASVPDAPTLLSATKRGSESDLSWTAVDLATHYAISYGLSSGNYIYGVDNTGNVTSFTVGGLDPAADYCFAVRAVNDCAPSGLSNEICTGEVLGQVLGVTTLADTGDFAENLFYVLFIMGSVCAGVGLKLFLPVKKLA